MSRRRGPRLAAGLLALGLALGAAAAPPARACAFDAWLPPLTLVDRLFDADAVALAAADPEDPSRWRLLAAPAAVSATPCPT